MKKLFFGLVLSVSFCAVQAQKEFINDPHAETRKINGSFSGIKVSGSIDIYLSQAGEEAVAVSAPDEKIKSGIKTRVENNTLVIYYENSKGWSNWKNKSMKVYIAFKNLEKIQASGASDVRVSGSIKTSLLKLEMSGASDFKGVVDVTDLNIELSGASDAIIRGKATNVVIESSGSSDVKAYDLITDYCKANVSGASDVNITVNKELTGYASGASDIYFKGNGIIKEKRTSGSSDISKRE